MASVTIPIALLPLWALAVATTVAGLVAIAYWLSEGSATVAAFVRASAAGALFWSVQALAYGARTAAQASALDRLYLPASLVAALGLIDATIVLNGLPRPKILDVGWAVGVLAFALLLAMPGAAAYFPVHRVPDGFYLARFSASPLFEIARLAVAGGAYLALAALALRGFVARRQRRWLFYAAAALFGLLLAFVDTVWVQAHRVPFPLTWIAGVVLLGVFWLELRREVRTAYFLLHHDQTTGARSRAYGEMYGERCLNDGPVGAVYIDLDGFKSVNDRFGHGAGDDYLRAIVARLRAVSRPGDEVVRMGGDELIAILPGLRRQDGSAVLERLRDAVVDSPVRLGEGSGQPVVLVRPVVSMGFAWARQGESFAALVERADEGMYLQKEEHRRRGLMPTELPAPIPLATREERGGPRA